MTFNRSLWHPTLDALEVVDPGRRALALDLPGHGDSERWASYDLAGIADGVHRAVDEAGVFAPVVVGHSVAGIIASLYASRYPCSGVVNVDQPLQTAPFMKMVQGMADQLRSPAFADIWPRFLASMHIELLPEEGRRLVDAACRPDQELVLGYWREVLDRPVDDLAADAAKATTALRDAELPYLIVTGDEPDPSYRSWLEGELPQATFVVMPNSGHFPQVAHPQAFAEVLSSTGRWAIRHAGPEPTAG